MLKRLTLRSKLWISVGVPLLAILIISFISVYTINRITNEITTIDKESFDGNALLLNADRDMYQALTALQEIVYLKANGERLKELVQTYRENVGQANDRVGQAQSILEKHRAVWSVYKKPDSSKTVFDNFADFKTSFNQWIALTEGTIKTQSANLAEDKFNAARELLNQNEELLEAGNKDIVARNIGQKNAMVTTILLIDAGTLVLILFLVVVFIKSITSIVNHLADSAEKLAKGDINIAISVESNDELGNMSRSFGRLAERVFWYEALLDSIPFQMSVTDNQMHLTFINKATEDFMGVKRAEVIGKPCNSRGTSICRTENCSVTKLKQNQTQSVFAQNGRNFQTDISNILNAKGEKVGHVELIQDITAKIKSLDYEKTEVERLGNNLRKLASGDLDLDLQIAAGDQYTQAEHENFLGLNQNLLRVKEAVHSLVNDANQLAQAAVEGKLDVRADAGKHNGDYRMVIDGINYTLDAVIKPVKEASAVLREMAKGNLQARVKGDYQGDHAEIKETLNFTMDAISGYIHEIARVLTEMANGNLDVSIGGEYRGDFVQIKESLNLIIDSLNEILGEFNKAAEQVAFGAQNVADSSQTLSQGSTEQASVVEEITTTMQGIAAQTKQNAVNANKANELALSVKENAIQGNQQMQEMLAAMDGINNASRSISKIIKVIDEIAFQTNILALNAAVEAARAGQYGKGFAVVAEEVRNLAARSATAATETTEMIENSISKVESGTKIANDTADALNKIVDGVTRASVLVGDIAVASNEQATSIIQINDGVAQVSGVIQTNTATAEESAAASEELSGQAQLLQGMARRFRVRQSPGEANPQSGFSRQPFQKITTESAGKTSKNNKIKIALRNQDYGKY